MTLRRPFWGALLAVGLVWPQPIHAQGYAPGVAASKMTLPEGLKVTLFASEPEILQPIFVKVDDRGRLWTIQYLQYPNPAGLTRVNVDRWSRTVYDRIPEPPPIGPRGADHITILEDTDGDGRADRFRDFLDGMNIVTGVEFGHGGVYVLQAPYLLFYPDENRDDVPDGDPRVLLTGFGMEDAQSQANHLTWGPDGWLYGVNGSTTTCNIRGVEFQQGCWRYHPLRDEFELFCEGGSNTYGLTFDERGNLFYSTNGGPFVHALQGAYYRKSFGKHGPLHNLHAYGFFETVAVDKIPGGPPTGGTIYLGEMFPSQFRGTFLSGNFLGHTSSWWTLTPEGSTFTAKYGGVLLDSHDTWFGPTDMCLAPDGSMYLSDFHDQRTAHPDPDANWDRSNGRIYRITGSAGASGDRFDLSTLTSDELLRMLFQPNRWFSDRARVELARRRDAAVIPRLRDRLVNETSEANALQALWALHACDGLEESLADQLLGHDSEYVRMWTVRLLGDRKEVSDHVAESLVHLASRETGHVVRAQLAATARRLPTAHTLPILAALIKAVTDDTDSRVPWMIWWGLETHAVEGLDQLTKLIAPQYAWSTPAWINQTKLLIRRWAAEGQQTTYSAASKLIAAAPPEHVETAFAALEAGLSERTRALGEVEQGDLFASFAKVDATTSSRQSSDVEPVSPDLLKIVASHWQGDVDNPSRLKLALLCKLEHAPARLLHLVQAANRKAGPDPTLLALVREFGDETFIPLLVQSLSVTNDPTQLAAIVQTLGRFDAPAVTATLLTLLNTAPAEVRPQVIDVLLRRPASAMALLDKVADGGIAKDLISISQLRIAALHEDPQVDQLIRQIWGNISPGTAEEKLATMRRFNNDLRAATGDPVAGKLLYAKHCGICHVLHGEGSRIGPELTTANRSDRDALLANIVDPSAVIRREYVNYTVATVDGRVLTGLLAEQDGANVTVLDARNQRTRIARSEIEEIRESDVSLMPEKLLDALTPQERRDLFAYLQK